VDRETVDVLPASAFASANAIWVTPVVHRCVTTQMLHIPLGMLTPQEVRIHAAMESTLGEICWRLVLVGVNARVEGASGVAWRAGAGADVRVQTRTMQCVRA
jgi:hypothetical protein